MIDYAGLTDLDVLIETHRELAMDLQVLEGVIARLRVERARKADADAGVADGSLRASLVPLTGS